MSDLSDPHRRAKIEHLARAMCKADGFDPDRKCFEQESERGPRHSMLVMHADYVVPSWVMYRPLALAALDAMDTEASVAERWASACGRGETFIISAEEIEEALGFHRQMHPNIVIPVIARVLRSSGEVTIEEDAAGCYLVTPKVAVAA